MYDYYNYTMFIGFVIVLTMFFGYIRETKKYDIRFPEMSYEEMEKILWGNIEEYEKENKK